MSTLVTSLDIDLKSISDGLTRDKSFNPTLQIYPKSTQNTSPKNNLKWETLPMDPTLHSALWRLLQILPRRIHLITTMERRKYWYQKLKKLSNRPADLVGCEINDDLRVVLKRSGAGYDLFPEILECERCGWRRCGRNGGFVDRPWETPIPALDWEHQQSGPHVDYEDDENVVKSAKMTGLNPNHWLGNDTSTSLSPWCELTNRECERQPHFFIPRIYLSIFFATSHHASFRISTSS